MIAWMIISSLLLIARPAKNAKILAIFPLPLRSHHNLGSSLMRALGEKGHDITMISCFREQNLPKNGTYRDIVVSGLWEQSQSHGILEFSTEKAGQDVTPINLEFGEEKKRSSTLNSITGMLSQLKRSIPDLRLHKTHQPLIAQSTPPSSHRIRTIRRQSSVGTYQDSHQQSQQPQCSVPMSSSTSYYTNSPSPPHQGEAATMAHVLEAGQNLQHSTLETHSDSLVVSRSQLEHISTKLDHLMKRVQTLEQTLAGDVKTILTLLQGQNGGGEASSSRHDVPDYENVNLDPCRIRYTFQRSVSEPKPISKSQHSQVLHRFASFNKTFDFDKYQDPSWTDVVVSKEKEAKEDKSAPIAKLESLDELDLESPQGSPKKPKK